MKPAWRAPIAKAFGMLLLDLLVGLPLSLLLLATLVRAPRFVLELRRQMHSPLRCTGGCMHVRAATLSVPTRGRDGFAEVRVEGSLSDAREDEEAAAPGAAPAAVAVAAASAALQEGTATLRVWMLGDAFWRGAKPAVGGMIAGMARGMMPLQVEATVTRTGDDVAVAFLPLAKNRVKRSKLARRVT